MIDYAPLLQRACERLSSNTPQARAALFAQARHALEAQLHSVRPHLTSEAIAQELARLDKIIQTLEISYAHGQIPASHTPPLQPTLSPTSAPALGRNLYTYIHPSYWRQKRFLLAILGVSALLLVSFLWYFSRPLHRGSLFPRETSSANATGKAQDRLYKKPETLDDYDFLSRTEKLKTDDHAASAMPKELPVAQKAFLFEEDKNNTQDPSMPPEPSVGQVVWRLGTSDTEQGQAVSPTVETTITIPKKDLAVQMVLSKNTDLSLPASHTLKITFSSATSSSTSARPQHISAIGSPHFKEQREGRGAPLIGQTVPVLPNVFLMGLSNEGEDQTYNLNLLKSPGWIDIPILFDNNQHAIITFEKGVFGQHIIDQALKAWQ